MEISIHLFTIKYHKKERKVGPGIFTMVCKYFLLNFSRLCCESRKVGEAGVGGGGCVPSLYGGTSVS